MFDSFINWIVDSILEIVEFVFVALLSCLSFDLQLFIEKFPVAATLYQLLQIVAIGFVVGFAIWNLAKFFLGSTGKLNESPMQIAAFTILAAFLIYWGNNVLQLIMNLLSYPYQDMLKIDAVSNPLEAIRSFSDLLQTPENLVDEALGVVLNSILGTGLLYIVVMLILLWRLIKILLEIIERWMVLAVIVYTSPLAWPTVVSTNSRPIFSKWLNLFLSQCLMLLLNVWGIKMLFSVMTSGSGIISIVFSLTFCKVFQKLDVLLQQVGGNPAQIGKSILDDLMSTIGSGIQTVSHAQRMASSAQNALGSKYQHESAKGVAKTLSYGQKMDKNQTAAMKRSAAAGNEYQNSATGKKIKGEEAEKLVDYQKNNNGQLPNGVSAVGDYSRALGVNEAFAAENNKRHAETGMSNNNVDVAKKNGKPALEGNNPDDVAKVIAQQGNNAAYDSQLNEAFANSAKNADANQLEQIMNEAEGLDNQKVAGALMDNAATQAGFEEKLGTEHVADVQSAAAAMEGQADQQGLLMEQLGTADPNASYSDAMDTYNRLDDKFGADSGNENYALLNNSDLDNSKFTAGDLNDQSREALQGAAMQQYQGIRQDAANERMQSESLRNQAATAAQNGASQEQVDNLNKMADKHLENAKNLDAAADDFGNKYFGVQNPSQNATIQDSAPLMQSENAVSWNNLSDSGKQAALDDVKAQYNDLMAEGKYDEAADLAMSKTGSLDPTNLTVADMDNRSAADGHNTLSNMALSEDNMATSWSNVNVGNGQMTGDLESKAFNSDTHQYETTKTPVTFTSEAGRNSLSSAERDNLTETQVGAKTFYTSTGSRINEPVGSAAVAGVAAAGVSAAGASANNGTMSFVPRESTTNNTSTSGNAVGGGTTSVAGDTSSVSTPGNAAVNPSDGNSTSNVSAPTTAPSAVNSTVGESGTTTSPSDNVVVGVAAPGGTVESDAGARSTEPASSANVTQESGYSPAQTGPSTIDTPTPGSVETTVGGKTYQTSAGSQPVSESVSNPSESANNSSTVVIGAPAPSDSIETDISTETHTENSGYVNGGQGSSVETIQSGVSDHSMHDAPTSGNVETTVGGTTYQTNGGSQSIEAPAAAVVQESAPATAPRTIETVNQAPTGEVRTQVEGTTYQTSAGSQAIEQSAPQIQTTTVTTEQKVQTTAAPAPESAPRETFKETVVEQNNSYSAPQNMAQQPISEQKPANTSQAPNVGNTTVGNTNYKTQTGTTQAPSSGPQIGNGPALGTRTTKKSKKKRHKK